MQTRNTDKDWERIAETEPYFGVLSENQFLSKNLTVEGIEKFYSGGWNYISWIVKSLEPYRTSKAYTLGLDFGCGVGRLTIPMAHFCERVIGIDIATNMRRMTASKAAECRLDNLEVLSELDDLPSETRFDWINSYIVFQHIPPDRGYELLENALTKLAPAGVISLHFTLFRDRSLLERTTNDYEFFRVQGDTIQVLAKAESSQPTAYMSMFDYDMNVLLAIFHRHGISEVKLQSGCEGGHFAVVVIGKKSYLSFTDKTVALGSEISFSNSASNGNFLRKGFALPEAWGVWTISENAEIVLPLSAPLTGPTQLLLNAQAYIPSQGRPLDVTVYVNGFNCGAFKVSNRWPDNFIIQVPAKAANQSELRIAFEIKTPISPSEAGEGNDFRKLGIGLRSIQLGLQSE